MVRFLSSIIFALGAAYVHHHNTSQAMSVLMLPGMDVLFPSTKGSLAAQGGMTVYVFGGISVLLFLNAIRGMVADHRVATQD